MKELLWGIEVISMYMESLIGLIFYVNFLKKEIKFADYKKRFFLAPVLPTMLIIILYGIHFPKAVVSVFFILMLCIEIMIVYKEKRLISIVSALIYIGIVLLSNVLVVTIYEKISGDLALQLTWKMGEVRIFGLLATKLISIIIVIILSYHKLDKIVYSKKYYRVYALAMLVLLLINFSILNLLYNDNGKKVTFNFVITYYILAIIAIAYMLFFFYKIGKLEKKEYDNNLILINNQMLKKAYEDKEAEIERTDKLNHDIKNIISGIKGLAVEDKKDELLKMLDKLSECTEKTRLLINTGNYVVDSLMNQKIYEMKDKGIKVIANVDFPIQTVIETVDLCAIFGNLLDNAYEGAAESNNPIVHIILKKIKNIWIFKIRNTYIKEPVMLNDEVISTKLDGIHGIGLKSVKDALNRNNGMINISYDNEWFEVKIMFEKL